MLLSEFEKMAATPFDFEVQKAPQSVDDWLKYVEESESWQKVEKRKKGKKVKKFEDDNYFVICTPVGKGLFDQPIIGSASGTLGSAILIGYNLPSKAGTGLTGLPKSGKPSSGIPDPDGVDSFILPNQLNPDSLVNQGLSLVNQGLSLVNQGLDLQWTRSVTHPNSDEIYQPSGKPVYPHRLPLYERNSTLVNQENFKPWNTLHPSDHKPWVIIILYILHNFH